MRKLALSLGSAILIVAACQDVTAPAAVEPPDPVLSGMVSSSAVSYSTTQLDSMDSRAAGITDAGVVAGSFRPMFLEGVLRPVLWLPEGGRIMLEDFEQDASFAAINNHGTALGWVSDDRSSYFNTHRRGFLYADGQVVMVDGEHLGVTHESGEFAFEGPLTDDRVQPWDINDDGVVIARALFRVERPDHSIVWFRYAFAWQQGQPITYISGGQPTAINNHGVVIGFGWGEAGPIVWRPGSYDEPEVLTVLRNHFSGYVIELKDINDAGQIVGIACRRNDGRGLCDYLPQNTTDRRGFVLDGGRVVELLAPGKIEFQNAHALSDQGQIAGEVHVRQGNRRIPEPVVWTLSGATAHYQQLPAPFSDFYHGSRVTAINNVAVAAGNSYPSASSRAFVWRPGEGGGDPPPSGDGPTASFSYSCQNSATCHFTDTSTPGGSAISAWLWTSSAGNSASVQHTEFSFTTAGSYTVTLRVTDASHQSDHVSATVRCSMHQRHGLRCS
jgi:hypothetical protein